jgi:hypothetical protein
MAKSDLAGDYDAIELRNSEKNKKGVFSASFHLIESR